MSRALMSSRAETAVFCKRLSRILGRGLGSVEPVAANIGQNAVREQTAYRREAGGAPRKCGADSGGGDRLRRHVLSIDGAGRGGTQGRRIGREARRPLGCERRRQRQAILDAGPTDDDEVGEVE